MANVTLQLPLPPPPSSPSGFRVHNQGTLHRGSKGDAELGREVPGVLGHPGPSSGSHLTGAPLSGWRCRALSYFSSGQWASSSLCVCFCLYPPARLLGPGKCRWGSGVACWRGQWGGRQGAGLWQPAPRLPCLPVVALYGCEPSSSLLICPFISYIFFHFDLKSLRLNMSH